MLTGTPLDLTPFGAVLGWLGIIYWLLAALGLWLVLRRKTTHLRKVLGTLVVLLLFGYLPTREVWEQYRARERLGLAMAHFERRCKGAGEKISRTVENVDGVVWMRWRTQSINRRDQYALHDPYGGDCFEEDCIKRLLRVTKGENLNPDEAEKHASGYRYVEAIDPVDGRRHRYLGVIKSVATRTPDQIEQYKRNSAGKDPGPDVYQFALERQPIESFEARYGIDWEDVSTREDRETWIAGGAVRILDLDSQEVIAQRVGYLIDTGQGGTAGFRDPWGWARSYGPRCPGKSQHSWDFVLRVVQPSGKE